MKTQILIALMLIVVSSCASKRNVASTQEDQTYYDQTQHAQMIDGAASRIR